MNRLQPTSGDLFIQRSKKRLAYSPNVSKHVTDRRTVFKTTGIAIGMILLVLVINSIVAAGQTTTQAQSASSREPGIMTFLPQADTSFESNHVKLLASNTTTANSSVATSNEDIDDITDQINDANSAIFSSMRECIGITLRAKSDVSDMRDQEQELKDRIADINQELNNIDTSDPDRMTKRSDLVTQRNETNAQRNELMRSINDRKREFNADKRACQMTVSRQQNEKRKLENQLNNAYNRAVRIVVN
jgi:chromosome segregation ATPase